MLTQVAEGVLVHESAFMRSNAVVVQGRTGVLLIDPGITAGELTALARDLRAEGRPVVAGFSTHPHWDHLLWHAEFGDAPRYATARGAAAIARVLADPDWRDRVAPMLPPEYAAEIPMDLLGLVTGLPAGTARIPWDGPDVRIVEHQGHTSGHAALLVEASGVLVAGDMLSDVLIPFLDGRADDPTGDYLTGLERLADAADGVEVVVPGHGSVGDAAQVRARIALDRAYVRALRDGGGADDPRIGPAATFGRGWLPAVHERQAQQLAQQRQTSTKRQV